MAHPSVAQALVVLGGERLFAVAAVAAAAADSTSLTLIGTVVVAALALAGAIFTASSALRQSTQNNRIAADRLHHDRDAVYDARLEAEATRLRGERDVLADRCTKLLEDNLALKETVSRMRLALLAHGLDPDDIVKGGGHAAGPA
ncbi:hypothetical protein [Actinoplanes sp. NBRC 101535]|uniref:hypothetical protein n=1 Tax=Actinoplanes sp. NBRC 101535 TaxID=3032196 RepID=UPI0024A334E5|nr:hypothetical protein [Actinoplanes sp. NBRC 101535]GLY08208.1 hypothetical protein Acsp01_85870 [Actinoplanes sp. NBRC 101535]